MHADSAAAVQSSCVHVSCLACVGSMQKRWKDVCSPAVSDLFLYRTTPEEGGETVFPLAANRVTGPQWSECARGGAAVKARRGDALLFYRYVLVT